jgi:hypothetical protein
VRQVKIIVEKHHVESALSFHVETFGSEGLEIDPPVLEAFVAEAQFDG